jgi:hypothetical protein
MAKRNRSTAPGEGERRAQRGYTEQYRLSAAVIYAALDRGELEWIGLADRAAGIADDVVLGLPRHVVGHQFKMSRFPDRFRLRTLLIGADGLLQPLATAWQALIRSHPGKAVEIGVFGPNRRFYAPREATVERLEYIKTNQTLTVLNRETPASTDPSCGHIRG